jgi:hypothetical protein
MMCAVLRELSCPVEGQAVCHGDSLADGSQNSDMTLRKSYVPGSCQVPRHLRTE